MSLEEYKSRMPNLEEQKNQVAALNGIAGFQKDSVEQFTDQASSLRSLVTIKAKELAEAQEQTKTLANLTESISDLVKVTGGTSGTFDDMILAALDGTVEKYREMQKIWFKANKADKATPEELTSLVDKWYSLTRQKVKDWDGWVEFYNPDTSSLSTGTRKGDLVGMECVPSTDTEAGKNDFMGHPLFATTDCNWEMNGTDIVITAIDGISPDFERSNPNKYVGVLQMSGYHHWTERSESSQTEIEGYCATYKGVYSHIEPLPESVKMDGTMREWVIHGKYMAGARSDGGLTCCSGILPQTGFSHNKLQTLAKVNGRTYSGGTSADRSFITLMAKLLFASKSLDGILNGSFNYSVTENAEYPENNVKRVLLAKGKGAKFIVGSTVIIGSWDPKYTYLERDSSLADSIIKKPGCRITAIEEVVINDVTYDAIHVDAPNPFSTQANGAAADGTTYIANMPYASGINDSLKGNTGALDPTDGKHTISIQGIELMNGCYEVLADTILKLWQDPNNENIYYYTPYIVKSVLKQSTDITSDYIDTGINAKQPDVGAWVYIKHVSYKNGMYFADDMDGGSSSTYEKDAMWLSAKTTGTTREFLAFGRPGLGVPICGLSCVTGDDWLGRAWWSVGARLSPNGCRGDWQRS